jgi:hypothetical protein
MGTTTTSVISGSQSDVKAISAAGQVKRRSINPETGRALLILSHAIEHLAEGFALDSRSFTSSRGEIDAIQLLMSLNRKIYMACPEAPSFGQWFMSGFQKLLGVTPTHEKLHLQG